MSQQGDAAARPLYDRIEEIRVRNGWSKVQVARLTGLNRQTVANLARQLQPPMASTVIEIADALGIDRDEALQLAGIRPGDETAAPPPADFADDEHLKELLDRLPPELRRRAEQDAAIYRSRYQADLERLVEAMLEARRADEGEGRQAR